MSTSQKKPGIIESGVYNPVRTGVSMVVGVAFGLGPGEDITAVVKRICPGKRNPRFASMEVLRWEEGDRPGEWVLWIHAIARVHIGGSTAVGWVRNACKDLNYQCNEPRWFNLSSLTTERLVEGGHSPRTGTKKTRTKGSRSNPLSVA